MITCAECGAQSPEESIYCDDCGATLRPVPAPASGPVDSGASEIQVQDVTSGSPARRAARVKTPEWLKALQDPWDEGLSPAEASPKANEDSLVPTWLRGPEFEDQAAAEGLERGLERAQQPAGPGEIPVWLREFDEPAASDQANAVAEDGAATPVWLSNLEPAEVGAAAAPTDSAQAAGAPEWLAESIASEPAETVDVGPALVLADAVGEELLTVPTDQTEEAPQPADSLLAGVGVEATEPQVEAEVAESIPEWLRGLDIAAIQATLVSPADALALGLLREATSEYEDVLPAAATLAAEELEEAEPDSEPIEPVAEDDEAAPVAAAADEEVDEFTAWLRALTAAAAVRSATIPESEAAGPADERARLLSEVDELFYGAAGTLPDELEAVDPLPQWLDDVLRSVDEFSGEEGDVATALPAAVAAGAGAEAGWLEESGTLPADQDDTADRAGLGAVPAGAAVMAGDGPADRNGAPTGDADADALVEAELPEWLVVARREELPAMGGIAAATAVAASGPLAGIPGVLEREPGVYELPPPAGAVGETALTPEQRQQLALLEQLGVEDQESAAETARPRLRNVPAWLRLGVALLLLAVIVIGLLSPRPVEIAPSAIAAAEMLSTAVAAAAGQPVLVAFEYSPAMAGELSPMAGVLLRDLAANGSTALLASQSAAGITLGENLAAQTAGLSTNSIGYLPGEVIGLRRLAGCMSDPATCETSTGGPVDEALRQQLAEVALIVVLAAERDGLVSWIEQVSPVVDTTMVAGVTQAIAPLAAPYQSSRQLVSVLAGYPATVAYEQLAPAGEASAGSIAAQAWAYTLALWLAAGLIVAGAIYWLAGRAFRRGGA